MNIPLTEFEIEVLNKVIPTQRLNNPGGLPLVLRTLIEEDKEKLMANGMSENDFRTLQSQTAKNIFHFLRSNEFYYEREGGVFFLTDRGKQLQKQRTIQNYIKWAEERGMKNIAELHTIEQKGYLEKDQHFVVDKKNNKRPHFTEDAKKPEGKKQAVKSEKKSLLIPIITIIILVIAGLAARHYKLI